MIRHRDGRVKAVEALRADGEPAANVATAMTITIGTKTAETRSASRWIGALPDCAGRRARAIWASAVSAADLRSANDQAPVRVDRRTGHRVARATSTGTDSPVSID
jgi:hypothetical protein